MLISSCMELPDEPRSPQVIKVGPQRVTQGLETLSASGFAMRAQSLDHPLHLNSNNPHAVTLLYRFYSLRGTLELDLRSSEVCDSDRLPQ